MLHTGYHSRRRIHDQDVTLNAATAAEKVPVTVCVGTSCFLRGSQELLRDLLGYVNDAKLADRVDIRATFCHERCDRGPTVSIAGRILERCTAEQARATVLAAVEGRLPAEAGGCCGSGCKGCGAHGKGH